MFTWWHKLETESRAALTAVCLAIVALVGWADYLTGYNLFFFIFYLFAVFLATWHIGIFGGILMSALSVTAWVSSDIAAGKQYTDYFTPVWNAMILFVFYLVVVFLLARLRALQRELEERVKRRTAELTREIQERVRLQKELLETAEREQQRISHDLHDSLCQHLTGTALAGHALSRKLAAQSASEAREANRLVELVEEAIELTRRLSRGLHPVELQSGNLADGFQELAAQVRERFKVPCRLECGPIPFQPDATVSAHLYRIAQEAITNAVRHGKCTQIDISLHGPDGGIQLSVTDDGLGLPENAGSHNGMGLRTMAYRAELIGGSLQVERRTEGGTRVMCRVPGPGALSKNHG